MQQKKGSSRCEKFAYLLYNSYTVFSFYFVNKKFGKLMCMSCILHKTPAITHAYFLSRGHKI